MFKSSLFRIRELIIVRQKARLYLRFVLHVTRRALDSKNIVWGVSIKTVFSIVWSGILGGLQTKKEYSLIGKIGSFKLQILSSSLSALDLPEFSALRIRLTRFLNLIGKVCF